MTEKTSMPTLNEALASDRNLPVILSYGGGTDSTALLIACKQNGVHIDAVLFSDTGGEKPHTYDYVRTMSAWLVKNNMPAVTILTRTNKHKKFVPLEQECVERGVLPAIAYGYKKCSLKYKAQPQEKYLNHWGRAKETWKAGLKPIILIGYNATETRRAKIFEKDKFLYRYPLIEWGIKREDCIKLIESEGLPKPGKSACFFCPNSKKHEILELGEIYPDLLERALKMEEIAKPGLKSIKGLGRHYAWGDLIAKQKEACLIAEVSDLDLPCGCYDGD